MENTFREYLIKEKENPDANKKKDEKKIIVNLKRYKKSILFQLIIYLFIQITYIDKKNKIKKDIVVDKNKPLNIEEIESKNILDEFGIKEQIKFVKSTNYSDKNSKLAPGEKVNLDDEINKDIYGLNDVYPVEGFIEFYSAQKNRKIKLHTYKYPVETAIKGIVYYVYSISYIFYCFIY